MGTLIDFIGLIVESFQHTLSVNGMAPASDARILQGIGTPLRAQLATWTSDAALIERLTMTYRAYNNTHHDARVSALSGDGRCRASPRPGWGVRLGVVTSKNRPGTVRGLRVAGLDDVTTALICAEDVTFGKPHREPVDRALQLLARTGNEFVRGRQHPRHVCRCRRAGRHGSRPVGALQPSRPCAQRTAPLARVARRGGRAGPR